MPHLFVGQGDRCETSVETARDGFLIIEADYREVMGHYKSEVGRGAVDAHGHAVVVAEERSRAVAPG